MATNILQQFLNRRLFDIGPDDTRLERIRKAAADLAASLSKHPDKTVRFALAAFDPDVPPGDPVLGEVEAVVQRHWNTYASCFADASPRPLFRAVLLEALHQAQLEDAGIAVAVALVARNVLPHFNVASERDVWLQVVETAMERSDEKARAEWDSHIELPAPEISVVEAEAGAVAEQPMIKTDRDSFLTEFARAAGPSDQQGQAGTDPNPYWPNNGANWSHQFVPRATEAIAGAVDKAFASLYEQREVLAQSLTEIVQHHVDLAVSTVASVVRSAQGLQRRTELLWWKEAMYSPSTSCSYRALSPIIGATQMAVDLHHQVPAFCPQSVEYFLRETVNAAFGPGKIIEVGKPLRESVISLASCNDLGAVRTAFREFRQSSGRGPLVGLLADAFEGGNVDPERFTPALGIDSATKFTPADLSVWIFRELQALRATGVPVGAAKNAASLVKTRVTPEGQA